MLLNWVVVEVEKNILKTLKISFINIMVTIINWSIIFLISSILPNSFSSLRLMKLKGHLLSEPTLLKPEEKNSLNLSFKEASTLIHWLIGVPLVLKSMRLKYQLVLHLNILLDTICFKAPHHFYQLLHLILNHMRKFLIWPQLQAERPLILLNLWKTLAHFLLMTWKRKDLEPCNLTCIVWVLQTQPLLAETEENSPQFSQALLTEFYWMLHAQVWELFQKIHQSRLQDKWSIFTKILIFKKNFS